MQNLYAMKIINHYYYLLLLAVMCFSCNPDDVERQDIQEEEIVLKKEEVLPLITSKSWGLTKIMRKVGTETSELSESPEYTAYKTAVYFTFGDKYLNFWTGKESTSEAINSTNQFPGSARTFSVFTRIQYPMGLDYYWDDEEGTMVMHCYDGGKVFKIPLNALCHLEKSSVKLYQNFEEAKAAKTPENITFIVEDTDPSLGPVTYYYSFRPIYLYVKAETQWNDDQFVMF